MRPHVSDLLHLCLIEAHLLDDARQELAILRDDVERIGGSVAGRVAVMRTDAWLARAAGDRARWAAHAHALVCIAREHRLALVEVDATELLAAALAGSGDRERASRMFASAAGRRKVIGYRRRFVPLAERVAALAAELGREHPDAHASWPPALD